MISTNSSTKNDLLSKTTLIDHISRLLDQEDLFSTNLNKFTQEFRNNYLRTKQNNNFVYEIKITLPQIENINTSSQNQSLLRVFILCYNIVKFNNDTLIGNNLNINNNKFNILVKQFNFNDMLKQYDFSKKTQSPELVQANLITSVKTAKQSIHQVLSIARLMYHNVNHSINKDFIGMCQNIIAYYHKLCKIHANKVDDSTFKELKNSYDSYHKLVKENYELLKEFLNNPICTKETSTNNITNVNNLLNKLQEKNNELENQQQLLHKLISKDKSISKLTDVVYTGGGWLVTNVKATDISSITLNFKDLIKVSNSLIKQHQNKIDILSENILF